MIGGIAALAGRIMISILFLSAAYGKIIGWEHTSQYMTSSGIPYVPFFLTGAVVLLIVGGVSILLGYRVKIGTLALIVFLIPTTLIFHDFWNIPEIEPSRNMQRIMFLKNLAIMGGLLYMFAIGGGPLSLDSDRRR